MLKRLVVIFGTSRRPLKLLLVTVRNRVRGRRVTDGISADPWPWAVPVEERTYVQSLNATKILGWIAG